MAAEMKEAGLLLLPLSPWSAANLPVCVHVRVDVDVSVPALFPLNCCTHLCHNASSSRFYLATGCKKSINIDTR